MNNRIEPQDLLVAVLKVKTAVERCGEVFLKTEGLTMAQFNILNLLGSIGKMKQANLVEELLVGKASVSVVLNRMIQSGLIKWDEDPNDLRTKILGLTPKGRALWKKIEPQYTERVKKVFGVLPISHRQRFFDDLKKVNDALWIEAGTPEDNCWDSAFSN